MKLFGALLVAVAVADNKKVPPKTPAERIDQLKRHITRLMDDHFSSCRAADKWETKMHKICDRALKEFNRLNRSCGFFDDSLTHGGPDGSDRKRRDVDFGDLRYSDLNAVDSINGITAGMRNWSR